LVYYTRELKGIKMANDKERNAIATEIYGRLNFGRLKDKLDWVGSVTFTITDRLEAASIKEISGIVDTCKDTKLIDWAISVHNGKLAISIIDIREPLNH
jgi:hypothetical protein